MTTDEPTPEPAPTSTLAETPASSGGRSSPFAIGLAVVLLGVIAMVGSAFLDWFDFGNETFPGTEIPAELLIDNDSNSQDPSMILPVAIAAAVAGLGALLRKRAVSLIGGILGVVIFALYWYQFDDALGQIESAPSALDTFGIGIWVALAGAVIAIVGSLLPQES